MTGCNARGNDERGGWELNGEHIQRSRVRIDTRKWMLSKMLPKVYGDKTEVAVTGANGGPVQSERVTVPADPIEAAQGISEGDGGRVMEDYRPMDLHADLTNPIVQHVRSRPAPFSVAYLVGRRQAIRRDATAASHRASRSGNSASQVSGQASLTGDGQHPRAVAADWKTRCRPTFSATMSRPKSG